MQQGEWWLDESGQTTYADGDVGDANHEMIAYTSALGLPMPGEYGSEYDGPEFQIGDRVFKMHPGDLGDDPDGKPIPITPQNSLYAWLKENGVDARALKYFGKENADARDYAIQYMGWIRIKGANIDVWTLDDATLRRLQRSDIWDEEDEADEESEAFVEERKTGKTWSIPFNVLLKAESAAGLKRWMEGAGQWHRSELGENGKKHWTEPYTCPECRRAGLIEHDYEGVTTYCPDCGREVVARSAREYAQWRKKKGLGEAAQSVQCGRGGAWITPSGELHYVTLYGHEAYARKEFPRLDWKSERFGGILVPLEAGFVRLEQDGVNLAVDVARPLTDEQVTVLSKAYRTCDFSKVLVELWPTDAGVLHQHGYLEYGVGANWSRIREDIRLKLGSK